ncbi:hypothetical protein NGRA_3003 [Nosema granulosis]|uniref:CCHC-type domain-containing protein n=1 Tax=Nosema granulosis TaxID=83296 RepID=A0A9P6GVJ3_9MICR|nr:hypothetical protein NGRA_3003 [Nosema granulosis]
MVEQVHNQVLMEFRVKQREERYRLYRQRRVAELRAECFICKTAGHWGRNCKLKKKQEEIISKQEVSNRRENSSNNVEKRSDSKRVKTVSKLKDFIIKYPEVFKESNEKIK